MPREEYKRYFDILEIDPEASPLEIRNAYIRLKKLYSSHSIVISPIADEFPKKRRQEVLQQIEEAYSRLLDLLKDEQREDLYHEKSSAPGGPEEKKAPGLFYSGEALKQIRERIGIQLFDVALDTKIRVELLQNIELEKFDALPPEVYLKGHLHNYASYLMLDPKKVAEDYLKRYRAWKSKTQGKS